MLIKEFLSIKSSEFKVLVAWLSNVTKINSMKCPKSKSLYVWLYITEIFLIHNEEWCVTKQWKALCIVCIHKEVLIKNALLVTTCYLIWCFTATLYYFCHPSFLKHIIHHFEPYGQKYILNIWFLYWPFPKEKPSCPCLWPTSQAFPVIFSWAFLTFCILKMQLGDSQLWYYKAARGLHLIRQQRPLCSNS